MEQNVTFVFDGTVAAKPSISPKGVGLKVMIPNLGDTYRVFIETEKTKGEQMLNVGDSVKVDYLNMYASNNNINMNVINIRKDNNKKAI